MAAILVAATAGRVEDAVGAARRADRRVLDDLPVHAGYHGVVGPVHLALRDEQALPRHVRAELVRRYHLSLSTHLRISADLRWAADVLAGVGVPWAVVKGPALAATYRRPDLRTYKDLDLLVGPGDFPAAVRALEAAGATVLDRNWTLVRRELRGQLHLELAGGTVTDLHWHLVNQRRDRFRIDTDELLQRVRRTPIADRDVPTLEPVDALLHVCLHAALSGGDRLVWLADTDRCVEAIGGAWAEVVRRARSWRIAFPVGVVLARAGATLGTAVPAEVLRALLPAVLGTLVVRTVGWIEPAGSRTAAPTPARLLVRATAWGPRSAVRDASARLWRRLRRVDDRALLTNPMLRTSGGLDDREAYLAAVAARRSG